MTPQPSRLTFEPGPDGVIHVAGVIDSHTAGDLDAAMQAAGTAADVTLDVSAVEFIDSSGLRSIITAHQTLEGAGHHLRLLGASEAVLRLLDITGLRDHLHLA